MDFARMSVMLTTSWRFAFPSAPPAHLFACRDWKEFVAGEALVDGNRSRLVGARSGHLLNFILFCLRVKNHGGKINYPSLIRWKCSPFVPPSHSLVSVSDSWRASWADKATFQGPRPCLVCFFQKLRYIQGHRQLRRTCCGYGREPTKKPTQTLNVFL